MLPGKSQARAGALYPESCLGIPGLLSISQRICCTLRLHLSISRGCNFRSVSSGACALYSCAALCKSSKSSYRCERVDMFTTSGVAALQHTSKAKYPCALLTLYRTTTISALKLYEMKSLNESDDPAYTAVNLSVFANAEVFAGAFTASLPPLRKTFEILLRKIIPTRLTGASTKHSRQSYALQGAESHTRPKHETDIDSECDILPDDYSGSERKGSDHAIMETTQVWISADAKSIASRRNSDWV
jgi:hypothetical protein